MHAANPVLVIAAHPDDEILGCGGTVARLVQEGRDVCFAIMGEGITSRYPQREAADAHQVEQLRRQVHAAAKRLGVKEVFVHHLPDNRLDSVPLLEVVKLVEDVIDRVKPKVIYTHHPGDLNIDHGVIYRAVLTATRPTVGQTVREIYAFEVPSATEWAFQSLEPTFRPNVFVDISTTIDAKIEAMECYESEKRKFPHPRSPEALRALATRWGSAVGCAAAEAFELVRAIRPLRD